MRTTLRRILLAAAFAAAAASAHAQAIYRCGNSYGNDPCPGGSRIEPVEGATARQAADARTAAQRDAKLASQLERERLAQEARAPKALILPDRQPAAEPKSPASAAHQGAKGKHARKKQPDNFTAVVPGTTVRRKKQH